MGGGAARVGLSAAVFVVSGLVQTVSVQAILNAGGGGERTTFLVALPNYAGILLVYAVGARAFRALDRLGVWEARRAGAHDPARNRVHVALYGGRDGKREMRWRERLAHRERRKLFVLAFNELAGFLTGMTGLAIAGSGLYQVVFSGGTVFTALLSVFFLRKSLSAPQWLCVGVISAGLVITAEQVSHAPGGQSAHAASLISGVVFVLVSCLFYSANYVIAEHFLDAPPPDDADPPDLPPPSGLDLSLYTGGTCLAFFLAYVLLHAVPRWHELVATPFAQHRGSAPRVAGYYAALASAAFLHALSHYDVVATVGAVPVGVLNALRAVSVFAASSWLFCAEQPSQCYTARKGLSTAVVIAGAVGYSVASARRAPPAPGILPVDGARRAKPRRKASVGERALGRVLERSLSAPFLNDPHLAAAKWPGFALRKKDET